MTLDQHGLPTDFTACHKLADGRLASRAKRNGVWGWVATKAHTKVTARSPFLTDAELAVAL